MSNPRNITLKITRAQKHVDDLKALIEDWSKSQTIDIVHDHDTETGWHTWFGKGLPEPPDEWVSFTGDIAQNLRAALEYMVEALILANGGVPRGSNKFPIFSGTPKPSEWRATIVGMSPMAEGIIERMQPYNRPNRSQAEPLEILANFANIDKHHRPHVVSIWSKGIFRKMAELGPGGQWSPAAFRMGPGSGANPRFRLHR